MRPDHFTHTYSRVAIILHWVMALGIAALAAMGLVMTYLKLEPMRLFQIYQMHKSIGITILFAAFLRLAWRLSHRSPDLPETTPAVEKTAAAAGHFLLYAFMFALPFTGWALVSASVLNIPTVLYGILPWPDLPLLPALDDKAPAEAVLKLVHAYGAYALIALVAVHSAAALQHHFVIRDDVLSRMIPHLRRLPAVAPPTKETLVMISLQKVVARLALASLLLTAVLPTISAADAATWKVDPAKSRLGFSGTQTGTKFQGIFTRWNAEIEFDPDRLETSHIAVTVDLATAATNDKQRDTALPSKDWFDTGRFPTAEFKTRTINRKSADTYEAVGALTLRGVAAPLSLPFTLEINGTSAHAKGHAELSRRTFGIGQGPWATDQWVAFEAGIDIDVTATPGN